MRVWATAVVMGMAMAAVHASAACGSDATVADWGLHRLWRVERDCVHPERPARLAEVPWRELSDKDEPALEAPGRAPLTRDSQGKEQPERAQHTSVAGLRRVNTPHAPLIWPGMRVSVESEDENTAMHLTGVAVEGGAVGAPVLVRAGLSGATLHCRVLGSGRVQLEPVQAEPAELEAQKGRR